ncbi:hypothetical protein GCM10022254_17180 [Actinomadura meridiana]|uniref:Uncharacterized protein n=1 Tax=Actinomadura meridiana TaxID=559626 RepID=A0ABP8BVX1_9ACTN
MLQQGAVDLREDLVGQVADIDAGDLGADPPADPADVEVGHGATSSHGDVQEESGGSLWLREKHSRPPVVNYSDQIDRKYFLPNMLT